jgi:aconitate hydratase
VNFGILPLEFVNPVEYDQLETGDILVLKNLQESLRHGRIPIENRTRKHTFEVRHDLSARQVEILLEGGLINWVRQRL